MILVLDTSTSQLSIGIALDDGILLAEFQATATTDERGIHDTRLARETEKLLQGIGVAPNQIRRIGLTIGPGSFTGLRIGLAFAKGLAFATGAGIVPLTQHEVLKASYPDHDAYIVTPGYRAEQVYVAESDSPRNIRLMSIVDFEMLAPRPVIAHVLLPKLLIPSVPSESVMLSVEMIAKLTSESASVLEGAAIDNLEPLYITEFQPGKT